MPVLDHEVHESVRESQDAKYGCHNRAPFQAGYFAPNGITTAYVSHRMSTECRYDMSLADRKCDGCKHIGSGEAYDQMVRGIDK